MEELMPKGKAIGFIGGGNMAEALIKGLLKGGVPAGSIQVAEPVTVRRDYLAATYNVATTADNLAVAVACDLLVLAVKPQVSTGVFLEIAPKISSDKLIISIMAGVTTASIESHFSKPVRVVRSMPNTPALVLQGATAIASGAHTLPSDLTLAKRIYEMVGKCSQVEEKQMDAVTGLSGSGPAYVLTFIEALSDAGVKNGLTRETASGLALQTVLGTAALLAETGEHPAVLREKVTSPGGTTIAGLQALEKGSFRGIIMQAVEAATHRSVELGKK